MSRDSGVYVDANDNPQEHAQYIAQLAGCGGPVFCDFVPKRGCDDNPLLKKYIFIRPPEKMWGKQLKYVTKKSGEKRFVPVSCSKNCTVCHGRSPGCGKNVKFDEIKADFDPSDELWRSLRSKPSEKNPDNECIIRYF
jgi:hypothetical protein